MKPVSTIVSKILEVAKIVACRWECPGGLPLEVMFELSSEEGICISQAGGGVYTQAAYVKAPRKGTRRQACGTDRRALGSTRSSEGEGGHAHGTGSVLQAVRSH